MNTVAGSTLRQELIRNGEADDEHDPDRRRVDGVDSPLVGTLPVLQSERSSRLHSTHFQWAPSSVLAMRQELRRHLARFPLNDRPSRALASGRGEGPMQPVLSPMEDSMKALIGQLIRDEQGQDLIEYGLLIGIITAGAITFINPIGSKVSGYFNNLNNNLP
jgi:Flp pilus assembly pilin Flp